MSQVSSYGERLAFACFVVVSCPVFTRGLSTVRASSTSGKGADLCANIHLYFEADPA